MMNRWMLTAAMAAGLGFAAGCGGSRPPGYPSPMQLEVPRSQIPAPGLCSWVGNPRARTCDGIENVAPLGSRVLYRPDDGSRKVFMCYLNTSEPREIIGIDVYDIDNRQIIDVLQRRGDPPTRNCRATAERRSG